MVPALLLIAQLYRVENQARSLGLAERLRLRQLQSQPILEKLRNYWLEINACCVNSTKLVVFTLLYSITRTVLGAFKKSGKSLIPR